MAKHQLKGFWGLRERSSKGASQRRNSESSKCLLVVGTALVAACCAPDLCVDWPAGPPCLGLLVTALVTAWYVGSPEADRPNPEKG